MKNVTSDKDFGLIVQSYDINRNKSRNIRRAI